MGSWQEKPPRDFAARLLQIRHERPADAAVVLRLTQNLLHADPAKRIFYHLCRGHEPVPALSYVVEANGDVIATLRSWPARIGKMTGAVLLGPLAVDPDHLRQGLGSWLMRHALDRAYRMQHPIALVWGEADFHERFGFSVEKTRTIDVPVRTSSGRLLGLELIPGALSNVAGRLTLNLDTAHDPEDDRANFSYFSFSDDPLSPH